MILMLIARNGARDHQLIDMFNAIQTTLVSTVGDYDMAYFEE